MIPVKGIRITACLVALVLSCLVVASVTASAHAITKNDPPVVRYSDGSLTLDGQPYFPIMALITRCPSSDVINQMVKVGVNTVDGYALSCGTGKGTQEFVDKLHTALQDRVKWMEHDTSVGYWPTGLPELTKWLAPIQWDTHDGQQLKSCSDHSAVSVYTGVNNLSKRGPVILRIPIAVAGGLDGQDVNCLTGARVSALLWGAVATTKLVGIEYLAQDKGQDAPLFDVPTSVQAQAPKDAALLKLILPAMENGTVVTSQVNVTGGVKVGAWKYNGSTVIVAVNMVDTPASASFTLPSSLKNVRVLKETSGVKISGRKFTDHFPGLSKHIYVVQ